MKVALMLERWMDETPLNEIEERFHTMSGQVLCAADQLAWLIEAAAAIAEARSASRGLQRWLRVVSERVQRGLREESMSLAFSGVELSRKAEKVRRIPSVLRESCERGERTKADCTKRSIHERQQRMRETNLKSCGTKPPRCAALIRSDKMACNRTRSRIQRNKHEHFRNGKRHADLGMQTKGRQLNQRNDGIESNL